MKIQLKNHEADKFIRIQPPGSDIIGKITRPGAGGTGALILLDTWEFAQITNGVEMVLDQKSVYTAIIRAILDEYCDEHIDLALAIGYSLDAIKSWGCGRRVPSFGTIKLILLAYGIINR
jgi:hypothetical protein